MRCLLILFIIFTWEIVFTQTDSVLLDNHFVLEEGIYASFREILDNNPRCDSGSFKHSPNFWTGKGEMTIYCFDRTGDKYELYKILLVVKDRNAYTIFQDKFGKIIQFGAISIFMTESKYTSIFFVGIVPIVNKTTNYMLGFIDLKTGTINKLDPLYIDNILKQDQSIYSEYSKLPDRKKKKTLYSYILKYNSRNPVYIKIKK